MLAATLSDALETERRTLAAKAGKGDNEVAEILRRDTRLSKAIRNVVTTRRKTRCPRRGLRTASMNRQTVLETESGKKNVTED